LLDKLKLAFDICIDTKEQNPTRLSVKVLSKEGFAENLIAAEPSLEGVVLQY